MREFFSIDGKFFKFGMMLWDVMVITFLWAITSIPVITIGASTTALYYVTTRMLSNREGYVTRDFFRSFKENFFQATGVTIVFGIAIFLVYFNMNVLTGKSVLFPIQFVIMAVLLATLAFVFPVLSRFKMRFFELIFQSFLLAAGNILTAITCLVLLGATAFLVMRWPILFIICAGCYGLLTSLMFMRIFKKYLPEMDTDEYDEKKHREMLKDNGDTEI